MPKSKSMCAGCRDNFYNQDNKAGCWLFANAEVVRKVRVGIWESPPYAKDRAEKCLSCFHPEGYAMLELTDSRVVDDVQATRERWDRKARQRMSHAEKEKSE